MLYSLLVKWLLIFVFKQAQCTNSEEEAKLHIPKCERNDTGKYTITVSNQYGMQSADVPVVVLGV